MREWLRGELLVGEVFDTLLKAKVLIDRWRKAYNTVRPHSSLGYKPRPRSRAAPVRLLRLRLRQRTGASSSSPMTTAMSSKRYPTFLPVIDINSLSRHSMPRCGRPARRAVSRPVCANKKIRP